MQNALERSLRLLLIDLNSGNISQRVLDPSITRRYLGGCGLGIHVLRSIEDSLEPMVFAPGLLVGYPVITACKTTVMGKSPLTGLLGESSATARWGLHLKRLGWDGIVLTGKSSSPVMISIDSKGAALIRGQDYVDMDIPEFDEAVERKYGNGFEFARVGAAAFRGVKLAGIVFDRRIQRFAARCGMGTLLADKGVKAILVKEATPLPAPVKRLAEINTALLPEIRERTKSLTGAGTAGGVEYRNEIGDLPIKNWQEGYWEGAKVVNGWRINERMAGRSSPCFTCPIRCTKVITPDTGRLAGITVRAPEYETTAGFGPMCLCDDPIIVVEANDLCDRYGIDTISVSSAIAFTMELYDRGILTDDMIGLEGVKPVWGSGAAILALIQAIAERRGIGDLLSQGIHRAAEAIGNGAEKYAIHVKGLDVPYHDPRCFITIGVTYATAARGGSHNESLAYYIEQGIPLPEIGMVPPSDPNDPVGKGFIACEMQNLAVLYDAIGLCKFMMGSKVGPKAISDWISACLGMELSRDELWNAANRIVMAKLLYNIEICGHDPADNDLPYRLKNEPRPSGGAKGRTVPLKEAMIEYYQARGLDEAGRPLKETLDRLDL